jgi:DNA-directed RNA polymerase specialized sigma24 family protein
VTHDSRRESGFATFAAECHPPLLHTALMLTGVQESAEKLVGAALLQAYLHWGRFAEGGSPHLYAHGVMVRSYARRWRRQPEGPQWPHGGLSRREWAALVLCRHEGLPPDRIAEELGCGVEEVRSACRSECAAVGQGVQEVRQRPYDVDELLVRGRIAQRWWDGARAVGILVLVVGCGVVAAGVAGAAVGSG